MASGISPGARREGCSPPRATTLFSVDEGGRALLWRPHGDEWVTAATLESEPIRLRWATFSEDGKWVAAMERSGRVRLHPVDFDTALYVAPPLMEAPDIGD
jgi:hypothetical protein